MLDLINVTHAAVIDCHGVKDGKGDFFYDQASLGGSMRAQN